MGTEASRIIPSGGTCTLQLGRRKRIVPDNDFEARSRHSTGGRRSVDIDWVGGFVDLKLATDQTDKYKPYLYFVLRASCFVLSRRRTSNIKAASTKHKVQSTKCKLEIIYKREVGNFVISCQRYSEEASPILECKLISIGSLPFLGPFSQFNFTHRP